MSGSGKTIRCHEEDGETVIIVEERIGDISNGKEVVRVRCNK